VPLKVGHLGTRKEDILTSPRHGLFFLDLELHDIGWVLNDFRDVSSMTRTNFTKDAFKNPNKTTNKPIPLRIQSVSPVP
jgi:hypothetical protein